VADASEDTLRLRDCYMFGTSTANIRIGARDTDTGESAGEGESEG
jgi:hypothetical protein